MIALSGCTQNVEASDPPTTVHEYRLIEADVADLPVAEVKRDDGAEGDEKQPPMRSPVEFD